MNLKRITLTFMLRGFKMSEELKTLKDIWKETETLNIGYTANSVHMLRRADHQTLKQEAIKWIKELDCELLTISNSLATTEEGYESYNIKQSNKSALILWIRHFFNLTDEDLK